VYSPKTMPPLLPQPTQVYLLRSYKGPFSELIGCGYCSG
jgi:hypothetical protein